MKVLVVNDYGFLSGGAERVSMVLRDRLRERGHDARLFASSAKPVATENPADYSCYGTESAIQPLLQTANPFAAFAIRRVLDDFRPDVVHVRMFLAQLSPAILPALRGYPSLLHVGGYHTVCPINTRILPDGSDCTFIAGRVCYQQGCVSVAGLARTVLQFAALRRWRSVFSRIVANSGALARRLAEGGITADRIIPNGTPVRAARPALVDPPTVAFAGRLSIRKGIDVLVSAMSLLVRKIPSARLIIAGDGPDRAAVARLISDLGLGSQVRMTGHLSAEELARHISHAWITAVPTVVHEAFSNSALESMMRGTAVVATDVGGFPEMIEHGTTGLLVPRADSVALSDALTRCLCDREACEVMGANARKRALGDFSDGAMTERFLELYEEILLEKRQQAGKNPLRHSPDDISLVMKGEAAHLHPARDNGSVAPHGAVEKDG